MFIGRRPDGSIYGTWMCRQPDDEYHLGMEELPDDHPDVVAFVNRPMSNRKAILQAAIDGARDLTELKAAVKQALGL